MASSRVHKYTTLKDVLKSFNESRQKLLPAPVDNPNSIVGYKFITEELLEMLRKRLDITNRQNNISDNYFKSSIQDYISRNKLSGENAKQLTEHRYYIYLNHFLRVFEKKYDEKYFYELEYITDKTGNFDIWNAKLFGVMHNIIKNRLSIEKIPFDSPRVSRLLVHGGPLNETFIVPDNLIICYSVPITYFGIMNLELLKLYEFIAKKYNNYVACPDLLQSHTHNSKYLQYFYPGQQIWNISMGEDTSSDKENFGEFFYDTDTQHFLKEGTTDVFFEKYNGKKLSEYCIGKTGILFVDACRACNAGYGLESQIVEFMCMYDTILKILNTIISEKIISRFDSESQSYANIAIDLQAIGNIEKNELFQKKVKVTVNFQGLYDLVKIDDGHKPFFDPFLSPNYDNSDTKRIYFNTEYSELSPSNPHKLSGNESNIKEKIKNIPEEELFSGNNISRNHILTLILNAISFPNNENNVRFLCKKLINSKNIYLITIFLNNEETIIDYICEHENYYIYGVYLIVYYFGVVPIQDIMEQNTFIILNVLDIQELSEDNIKYILKLFQEEEKDFWDNFYTVVTYNLIQNHENGRLGPIFYKNYKTLTNTIKGKLSDDITTKIVQQFSFMKDKTFIILLVLNIKELSEDNIKNIVELFQEEEKDFWDKFYTVVTYNLIQNLENDRLGPEFYKNYKTLTNTIKGKLSDDITTKIVQQFGFPELSNINELTYNDVITKYKEYIKTIKEEPKPNPQKGGTKKKGGTKNTNHTHKGGSKYNNKKLYYKPKPTTRKHAHRKTITSTLKK